MASSQLRKDTASGNKSMDVFIIGITGKIGGLLAQKLLSKGDTVHGLVHRDEQRADLAAQGIDSVVGDLASMTAEELAVAFGNADAIVFSAGSNGVMVTVWRTHRRSMTTASPTRWRRRAEQESTVLRLFRYSQSLGGSGTSATRSSITLRQRRKQTSRLVVAI